MMLLSGDNVVIR